MTKNNNKHTNRNNILQLFLSLVFATILFIAIYVASYFIISNASYNPQINIATDTAWKVALQLEKNGKIEPLAGEKIDISKSTETFVIIYDQNKNAIESNGQLNGQIPTLPSGVLENTHPGEKHTLTWQPEENIRLAAVTVSAGEYGYVLAARSLSDTEFRIGELNKYIAIGYIASIIAIAVGFYLFYKSK